MTKARLYRLLAVTLLLTGLDAAPGAETVAPSAETAANLGTVATLQLYGGDYVAGDLCDCDRAGVLRWRNPAFVTPLEFRVRNVSAVCFPTLAERPKPSGQFCLELEGGDVLFGDLAGLSAQEVRLDVPALGLLHVQRSALRRIARWRGDDLVYVGPNGLSGWKELSPDGAWEQEGGHVFTVRAGASLFGDFGIPAQACIEFELSWTSAPDFVLALGAGREPDERAVRLEVLDRQLVLLRETKDAADLAPLQEVASETGRCHFRVYLDQERGRAIVLGVNGQLLADLTLPDAASRPGSGMRLVHHHGAVRLEQLRITRWNGQPPREAPAGKSRLHRADGSTLYGEIKGFDATAKEFLVVDEGRETRIRADLVESVVLPGAEGSSSREMRAVGRDGTRLSGSLRKVEKGRVWLACPGIAEPLGLRASDLQMLLELQGPPLDVRTLAEIESEKARTPEIRPGRSGRLEMDSARLRGSLADGRQQPGASCLVWRPRGSSAASPLKPEVSARIVYRDPPTPPTAAPQTRSTVAAPRVIANVVGAIRLQADGVAVGAPALKVVSPYGAAPAQTRRFVPALYLRTGDMIPCTVKRIDEHAVTIESSAFDVTSVTHDKIKAVDLENRVHATRIDAAKRDRLLTLPRMQRDDPPTHLIRSTEGDYLRGRLVAMDDKTVTVEVRQETRRLPREHVTRIIWLSADWPGRPGDKAPGATPAAATRVQTLSNDGIRLTFCAESVAGTTLQGTSDVLGACRVDINEVDQLLVGAAIEQVTTDLPYQRWRLTRAADPKYVLSEGKQGGDSPGTESSLVGKPAPDFELQTLDGRSFRLSEQRGKIVVLDFWATWCGPCTQTLPQIARAAAKYREQDLLFLAVNLQETPQAINAMLARLDLKTAVALDRDGAVARKYAAVAIPQTVVIDGNGNVSRLFVGGGQQYVDQVREAMQAAVTAAKGQGTSP